jgi:hypothetical protein
VGGQSRNTRTSYTSSGCCQQRATISHLARHRLAQLVCQGAQQLALSQPVLRPLSLEALTLHPAAGGTVKA